MKTDSCTLRLAWHLTKAITIVTATVLFVAGIRSFWQTLRRVSSCLPPLLVVCIALLDGCKVSGVELPQKHEYQVELRNYLATLKEQDFKIELKPVKFVEDYFTSADKIYRFWILRGNQRKSYPSTSGIKVHARHFTLNAIEGNDGIKMDMNFIEPVHTAWWAQWDYPGNPYHKSEAVMKRALVASIIDMMMLDNEHDRNSDITRSDYLGGSMIRYGYTYWVIKDSLPKNVQEAYEQGMMRMFEKLEKMVPHGRGGSDLEFFQLVGMWYAADAMGSSSIKARALKRAHKVIGMVTSKTGYEKHGGAFDVSYQGIALHFLTWAAMLYADPVINDALRKMLVLKSHLTLPEPDGKEFGPTHFNTGTAADAPHDQWSPYWRDIAMAMVDDQALYTVWSRIKNKRGLNNSRFNALDTETMYKEIRRNIINISNAASQPSSATPVQWKEGHWVWGLNYAYDQYKEGFFSKITDIQQNESSLMKPPYGRKNNFIVDLNDGGEFLVVKMGEYGAIIHTGSICKKWANGVSGKSGGSLSAFWTPERGTAILGLCRGAQSKTPDEWTDSNRRGPYTWGVHAITGKGTDGQYFSTARIKSITSEYRINGTESAFAIVSGDLAGSRMADPKNALKGKVMYNRQFKLDKNGVEIVSSLESDSADKVQELWEMIPVYLGNTYFHGDAPMATVEFLVNGSWHPASETVVMADTVRLSRYKKHVYIAFEKPKRVRMSPDIGHGTHGTASVHNVMIDLLKGNDRPSSLVDISIRYRITSYAILKRLVEDSSP